MKMNDDVVLHIQNAVNQIHELFLKAATRIEDLKPGEKVPATQLAADLASERGMTGPQLYPVLIFLIKGYPGVEVKRGAHGGIVRPLPIKIDEQKLEESVKAGLDNTNDNADNSEQPEAAPTGE